MTLPWLRSSIARKPEWVYFCLTSWRVQLQELSAAIPAPRRPVSRKWLSRRVSRHEFVHSRRQHSASDSHPYESKLGRSACQQGMFTSCQCCDKRIDERVSRLCFHCGLSGACNSYAFQCRAVFMQCPYTKTASPRSLPSNMVRSRRTGCRAQLLVVRDAMAFACCQ